LHAFSIAAIKHQTHEMAARIHAVQIAAYQQEAALLGVSDFPPLARTVDDIMGSRELFFGAFDGEELLGVIGVEHQSDSEALISSLTVAPPFQRRGVGGALIAAVAERVTCTIIAVSTGAKNYPALTLFKELGFVARRHKCVAPEQLEIVDLSAERSNISLESRRSASATQLSLQGLPPLSSKWISG
jgi:ribosomal protein S18 acetylase RimI-like enzyme